MTVDPTLPRLLQSERWLSKRASTPQANSTFFERLFSPTMPYLAPGELESFGLIMAPL
jgi:hypothetical protein